MMMMMMSSKVKEFEEATQKKSVYNTEKVCSQMCHQIFQGEFISFP